MLSTVVLPSLLLSSLVPSRALSQRLAELKPGTLVRIVTVGDGRAQGPIAEVRGDSVYLSSTVSGAERTIPLSSITSYEYSDGYGPGRPLRGALVGGAIGFGVGYLAARGDGKNLDDSMFIGGNQIFLALGLLGTISGFAIGAADKSLRWVRPSELSGAHGVPPHRPRGTLFSITVHRD